MSTACAARLDCKTDCLTISGFAELLATPAVSRQQGDAWKKMGQAVANLSNDEAGLSPNCHVSVAVLDSRQENMSILQEESYFPISISAASNATSAA